MPLPAEALETGRWGLAPIGYSSGGEEEDSLFVFQGSGVLVIFVLWRFLCELFIHCCHSAAKRENFDTTTIAI
jgi:hypothetical protein